MNIKLNETLKGVDGVEAAFDMEYDSQDLARLEAQGFLKRVQKKVPMTLKSVSLNAILTPMEGDDEQKKYTKWGIYKKILESTDEVNLSVEEIAMIKNSIGKFYHQLIMGQCFDLLESNPK